jgi:hypothetical protein
MPTPKGPPVISESPTGSRTLNEVHPLSDFMHGTLTLVLESGGVFQLPCTAENAITIREGLDHERGSDALRWSTGWFQIDPAKIVATHWKPLRDYGWPVTADDRAEQIRHGHPNGVIASLVAIYHDGPAPRFSGNALLILSQIARAYGGSDFATIADGYRGEVGARLAADLWARADDDTADRGRASQTNTTATEPAKAPPTSEASAPNGHTDAEPVESEHADDEPHDTEDQT